MQLELVTWKVFSLKPLIQSNPHMMWESSTLAAEAEAEAAEKGEKVKRAARKKGLTGTNSENYALAESQLYVNDEGQSYHPAEGFWSNLLQACGGRNVGVGKPALTAITQGVALMDEEFLLCDPKTMDKKAPRYVKGNEWQLDKRRAVNHNKEKTEGGVGVVAIRPKWKVWGGLVTFQVDREMFGPKAKTQKEAVESITSLLNIGGHLFGIGVGRRRIKAMVRNSPVWSGFGAGKYRVEVK